MVRKLWLALLCMPYFLTAVEGDPFILCTVPKSGTHLSGKFLSILSGASGELIVERNDFLKAYRKKFANGLFHFMHFRDQFDPKMLPRNVVPIVNVRDPRDVCVSNVFYYQRILNELCGEEADFGTRLSFTIQYEERKSDFGPLFYFQQTVELIDTIHPIVLSFEDLIGPQGGGSLEAQLNTIYSTAASLHIPMNEERALGIANQLFGDSKTFREGQIGSWRTHFTEEHKAQFKASGLEHYLIRLGYESNHEW